MLIPCLPPTTQSSPPIDIQQWITTYSACAPRLVIGGSENTTEKEWQTWARWARGRARAGPVNSIDVVGMALNSGCVEVIVDGNKEEVAAILAAFPGAEHRICVLINMENETTTIQTINDFKAIGVRTFQIQLQSDTKSGLQFAQSLNSFPELLKKTSVTLYLINPTQDSTTNDIERMIGGIHRVCKDYAIHVALPLAHLPVESSADQGISIGRVIAACAVTPKDGLFPTVVTDTGGVALGFVYSNVDSLCVSTAIRRGVYWSRSRQELWRKGDTSGATQDLLAIDLDCDSDCLRFTVTQNGDPAAFCHRNERTCWGEDVGIPNLFRTLESRKKSAPAGSYTAKLYKDPAFLRDKMLEEAQELAEAVAAVHESRVSAAAATTPEQIEHVNQETADVLYFCLAGCVAGGGSLARVEEILDARALKVKRRTGETKTERIRAAEERLGDLKRVKEG